MDFRPLDPAQLPWLRRRLAPLRGPVARVLRWTWDRLGTGRSTWFDSRRWRAVWNVNRWFAATPRQQPELVVVRFGPRVRMELDLSRLTDVLAWCYGPGEMEVLHACRLLCPRDGVVADIGGNIGTTALAFAAHVAAGGGHVHVFEPSAEMRACLTRNVELSAAANVTVHAFGLSDAPTRGRLCVATVGNPGSAYVDDSADEGAPGEDVDVRRLDDEFADLTRLDFVKIDVEGFERRALRGGEATLRRLRPSVLFEVNDGALARAGTSGREVCDYLVALDYTLHYLDRGRLRDYVPDRMLARKLHNVIAVPTGKGPVRGA